MKRPRTPLCLALCLLPLAASIGCSEQGARTPSQPADEKTATVEKTPERPVAEQPAQKPEPTPEPVPAPPPVSDMPATPQSAAAPATTQPVIEEPRPPKRPKDTWVIFRKAIDDKDDADIEAEWRGDNKFRIDTTNVQRVTIDMTRLPEGPPTKGPWIIQIDDQGIELTGFKPKPGFTGHIRDLVRSKNGVWDVDRKRLYRLGG